MLLTHAYVLWAANELLAVLAPAFPLSLLRQEIRPQTAQAHSLGRYGQANKKKEKETNISFGRLAQSTKNYKFKKLE